MKPTKLLLVSVFIAAIILVMVGSITSIVMASSRASQAAADKQAAAKTASADELKAYQQREAQYKQLIEQANQQIEKANQQLQAIQGPTAAVVQTSGQAQPQAAPDVAVSADQATAIAQKVADLGQTPTKAADLVNFEGKTAYEVVFDKGSIYVDAKTGEVLFNGTVPQKITKEKAVQVASDYLQNKDVLQADEITFRGAPLFRVIFKNGTMVYLDTTGQITYMQAAQPKVVIHETSSGGSGGGSGGGTPPTSGPTYSEHEHESHGDD